MAPPPDSPPSFPVNKYTDSKTCVFWDVHDYPFLNRFEPVLIKQKITDAVRSDGYYGDLSIRLCVDENMFPDYLVQTYSDHGFHITFVPEDDDAGMKDKMILGMALWAFENRAPANMILVSKSYGYETLNCLEHFFEMGYYLVVSDPPEALEFLKDGNLLYLLRGVSDTTDYVLKRKRENDSGEQV